MSPNLKEYQVPIQKLRKSPGTLFRETKAGTRPSWSSTRRASVTQVGAINKFIKILKQSLKTLTYLIRSMQSALSEILPFRGSKPAKTTLFKRLSSCLGKMWPQIL